MELNFIQFFSNPFFQNMIPSLCIFLELGQDDKGWAGHFGIVMSAGALRVMSEVSPASGDEYSDVETSTAEERKQEIASFLSQLQEEYRDALKPIAMLMQSSADKTKGKHLRAERIVKDIKLPIQ